MEILIMKVKCYLLVAFTLPTIAIAAPLSAEQGDLILQELRQIRQLLEHQPFRSVMMPNAPGRQVLEPQLARPGPFSNSPAPALTQMINLDIRNIPYLGRMDAPLTMVMFTDYECPFCRRFESQTLPEIHKQYIASGKLKFLVMDAPVDSHPKAKKAAEALWCANDQNRYWEYRSKLSSANDSLEILRLQTYAKESGLEEDAFMQCVNSNKYSKNIDESIATAVRLGVGGTPTFFIGIEKEGGMDGVRIVGAQPFSMFEQKFNAILDKAR